VGVRLAHAKTPIATTLIGVRRKREIAKRVMSEAEASPAGRL
jgi:hypothetical protein